MNDDIYDLIDELAPGLAAAFIAAISVLRSGINYPLLLTALRNGDIEAAIDALNIDRGAFGQYVLERQAAFARAGTVVAEAVTLDRIAFFKKADKEARGPRPDPVPSPAGPSGPRPPAPPMPPTLSAPGGGQVIFRFDMTNPRAEARIRTEAAARVTGYVEEQIEIARRVIADGFQRGDGPQNIATDIAGRINPLSGRREGGIVGLSNPQVGYTESMRARLLSGDPDEMMKVLGSFRDGKWVEGTGMTLRDRRFDRSIMKAIRDVAAGKKNPLTRDRIEEMVAKYSDRLLKRRAEDIARTETASGVEMARAEATRQALEKVGLPGEALTKGWYHSGSAGEDARVQHVIMHGREVVGIDTHFVLPDGTLMLYPHDPAGGAKHNSNCRCRGEETIDWAFGLFG